MLPFAFLSDRKGKLKLALSGQVMIVASMLMIMSAGWGTGQWPMTVIVIALIVFSIGGSLQGSNWFALLSPIIPPAIRGRFFGRLRVTFMTVSIVFTLLVTRILKVNQTMVAFQLLLGLVFVAHIFRYFTYSRIPELENGNGDPGHRGSFRKAISALLKSDAFNQFNGYLFLITLFTAGVPILFALMQKDVFKFTPAQITLMGTLFLAGSVGGNLLGGRLVDRFGTRFVFLMTQFAVSVVIFGMLMRHWVPWSLPIHTGLCEFLFNMTLAVQGIAVTSEMLALIPSSNKSLATAVSMSLFNFGVAISGLFVARSISWELLASEWQLLGHEFTRYDSLLLLFASLVLIMLIAIGLVPKVVKKAQLMPGSGYPRI